MNEIDAIAGRTEFNTRTLLDGGLSRQGAIRGGEWEAVQQVRTNAPARINSLDQFLRTTSSVAFDGSFADLLNRIGADLNGAASAEDWIAMIGSVGAADASWQGIEDALNAAMGMNADNMNPGEGTNRWGRELYLKTGLTFNSASDLLDAFVQGLTRPNALRHDEHGNGPTNPTQAGFRNWDDFVENANSADPRLNAGTFSRAHSTSGGVAIWEALASDEDWLEANNITNLPDATGRPTATFAQVRAAFTNMTNNEIGWLEGQGSDVKEALMNQGWLARKFGDVGSYDINETDNAGVLAARSALREAEEALEAARSAFEPGVVDSTLDAALQLAIGNRSALQALLDAADADDPVDFDGAIDDMLTLVNQLLASRDAILQRGYVESSGGSWDPITNYEHTPEDQEVIDALEAQLAALIGSDMIPEFTAGDVQELLRADLFTATDGENPHADLGGALLSLVEAYLDADDVGGLSDTARAALEDAISAYDQIILDLQAAIGTVQTSFDSTPYREDIAEAQAALAEANAEALNIGNAQERWDAFVNQYLTADTEIVHVDRWVPREAERERGIALWFQIGANSGQGISVEIGSMSTGTLFGREGANHTEERRIIDVRDIFGYNVQDGTGSNFGHTIADNAVDTLLEAIDSALAITTRQRSELGAVQNRLEFAIENLDISSENLSAANSRIRDADMAREMMSLTQANVLQQAAISMLAQANQAPQSVLQLLG
jgi:flagellin